MKSMMLRLALLVFGWLKRRSEAKAAEQAVTSERVEAVRRDAAIREDVAKMAPGEARKDLREKWCRLPGLILVAAAIGVSACTAPAPVVTDTACLWVRPILVADADQITDATARDILAHNEAWAARCRGAK
ncbi:MAG: hypothetical protein AAB368_15170 [bacterium]